MSLDPSVTALRTHQCGELRIDDVGSQVSLCGWVAKRREHGEHLAFVDLRDHTGIIQCVVDGAVDVRSEYVVRVTGTVRARFEGKTNEALATGAIEVVDCTVEVLAAAEPPPFQLDDRHETDENIRLRYRYLALRREQMQRNLRTRAKVNSAVRTSMEAQGFLEVETPMLIASTPEGARDFVVPSRLKPGNFYALPQSPQLFKQLCMVGGVDRYYQIARCLRDEDLRADRQFEFMQLDAEMSFASQDDVLAAISAVIQAVVESVRGETIGPIPTMTWLEAAERFGSDKPDVRFGMELVELTDVFVGTEFNAFKAACVKGICVPDAGVGDDALTRSRLDDLTDQAKRWGAKGLVWIRVSADAEGPGGFRLDSPIAKFLSDDERAALPAAMGATDGDLILIVADERPTVRHVLGWAQLLVGRRLPVVRVDRRGHRSPGQRPSSVHHAERRGPADHRRGGRRGRDHPPARGALTGL